VEIPRTKMTSKLFLGEGFLTIHDMKANGFDAHTANAVESLTRQKLYAKYGDQSPSPEIHAGFRWIAARELGIITEGKGKTKTRLDPKCWKGYKKQGTKMKGNTRVNNCVKEGKYSFSNAKQYIKEWGEDHEDGATAEEVGGAIAHRFMNNTDLMKKALEKAGGPEGLMQAIDSVADFHAGAEELGSSDISIMVREVLHELGIKEASLSSLRNAHSFDARDRINNMVAKNRSIAGKEKEEEEFQRWLSSKKKTDERKLTGGEKRSKESNFKKLKKHKGDFEKRYGKDAESVMHAVATKRAKGESIEENLKRDPKLPNLKVSDGKTDYEKKKYASVTAKKNESKNTEVKEDTMSALKDKFNSGPSDEMLRKKSEPWEEKVRADMAAGKDAGWFLDRKQGAGQKWSIGTKTWFDVEKYQKKRSGIGSRLKRMVGMESMIREYTEAGYFTK